jgi:REP element-mobilizing transposase RayT
LGCALFTAKRISFNLVSSFSTSLKKEGLNASRFSDLPDSQALFITLNSKDRLPVFRKDEIKRVLCDAIDEARKSAGLLLFAYVVMIDHLHLVTNQPKPISEVLRILKGITARRVIDYLKEHNYSASLAKLQHAVRDRNYRYSLWQTEKNVYPIFSEGLFMQKVNYIHNNPVRAGMVERAVDYRWSSARIWQRCPLEDEPLLMDVDRIRWRSSKFGA